MQALYRALADPTRREILKLLRKGPLTAGAIAEHFPMTKGSLSHHFNLLKHADLIRCERRGQQLLYSLNASVVEDLAASLLSLVGSGTKDGAV
jgi:DNA-binding transcriptional ArsR family regulator